MSELADYILVIDRDAQDRERLADYLSKKGYFVQTAETIKHALLIPLDTPPTLVFADLHNEEIASLPYTSSGSAAVPLVIVSETQCSGDVVACLRAGAVDFILKPVRDFNNVDDVIHKILDKIRLAKLNNRLQQELEDGNRKLREGIHELRADQKAGLQVQLKMLPEANKIIHGVRFDHQVKPSLYLSGDFLDYFKLDDTRSLFYFADVSGHGASSAFVTVLLKNLTMRLKRNFKRGSSDDISCPARFLKRVNQELIDSDLGKHITVFVAIFDSVSRELTYAIGGHFPLPIIYSNGSAEYMSGKGVAVGLFPEPEFEVYVRKMSQPFGITVFSDGILEVIAGETLTDKEKLLLDVVSSEQRGIESLLSALGLDDVDELPDDIAVLTVSDIEPVSC